MYMYYLLHNSLKSNYLKVQFFQTCMVMLNEYAFLLSCLTYQTLCTAEDTYYEKNMYDPYIMKCMYIWRDHF